MSGRWSIAPQREWNVRHFMNREPLSIERARAPTSPPAPSSAPLASAGSGPGGSDVTVEHGGARARRKCAAYLSGRLCHRRLAPVGPAAPAQPSPHAPIGTNIRKSARDHYLANKLHALLSKNIRVRHRAVAGRSPSRHGVAHANRFPAAGRLMRAGRAGAGGGSDARAQRQPSLSPSVVLNRCERDHDTSLSQRRLVNTNKPRSRDKYSTFTLLRTRARSLIA